jgi:hypothetical protein
MLDRIQEASAQELERALERRVEHEFEAARQAGAREAPIIGGAFDPDGPLDADLMRDVVRALLARKWAERELPPWMLPLPLSFNDCVCDGYSNRRVLLRAQYGMHLRGALWYLQYAMPFELFCAQHLGGA